MYYEALAAGAGGDWWHVVILQAPLGAAVNVTDGDEDIDTVGTGNPMAIPVHDENSTYDITIDASGFQWTAQFNTTSVSGGYEFIDIDYGTIHLTFDDEFRGLTLTVSDGGSNTGTFTAPATGNTVDVFVPALGSWTISGTVGGKQYDSRPVTISDYEVAQSTKLILVPVGKTVLPTDDIETWLLCGEIKDKNYTTLDEVLADEATLIKLLTNDNAIDYMKRSTTWIVNPGLVPVMTDYTVPSGEAFANGYYASNNPYAWKAFDETFGTYWQGPGNSFSTPDYVGYHFNNTTAVKKIVLMPGQWSTKSAVKDIEIYGSNDRFATTGDLLFTGTLPDAPNVDHVISLDEIAEYASYKIVIKNAYEGTSAIIRDIQFYSYKEAITESETAMSYIGAYDYAAEELLDDPVWNAGIMASDYWEKVFNAKVPVMTSDTTPFGKAFSRTVIGAGNEAYKAFDGSDTGTRYRSETTDTNSYIGYDFGFPVDVKKVKFTSFRDATNASTPTNIVTFNVQGVDGDGNRDVISNTLGGSALNTGEGIVNTNGNKYNKYLIQNLTTYGTSVFELQFYGRATGSVQSWLTAAGIAKPYTTMAEVLADHETLAALMTNHNAVDYLVTAKNLIPDIVADERAMFYIGRRNYAADSLLADEEWATAICNSDYWDKILTNIVPIMLSNTTPEGKASARTEHGTLKAFMAFDHSDSTRWCSTTPATSASNPQWIGYEFVNAVKIYKVMVTNAGYTANNIKNYTLQNGDNDSTRTDVQSGVNSVNTAGGKWSFDVLNPVEKKYWGLNITSVISADSGGNTHIGELQFYGREDVDETQILLRGASGANIYKKVSGVDVPITTLVGTTDEVTKAQILGSGVDAGEVVIYSDVANDPDSLSNDYHKSVKVDDNTIDIDVMPDDSIYWYGHEGEEYEEITSANGWTPYTNYTLVAPTKQTNYLDLNYTSANREGGVSTKHKIGTNGNSHRITTGVNPSNGYYGYLGAVYNKSMNVQWEGGNPAGYQDSASKAKYSLYRHDKNVYPGDFAASTMRHYCHALWLSKHNPAANFFSAANDTVYYVSGGVQVVFAETNDLGEAVVDFSKIPAGDYILYSSVADDPDNLNLNQKYHKQITVEEDMRYRKIYLMPDGEVLYWYGYVGKSMETVGAQYASQNNTIPTITHNSNSFDMASNSSVSGQSAGGYVTKDFIDTSAITKINSIINSGSLRYYNSASVISGTIYPESGNRLGAEPKLVYSSAVSSPTFISSVPQSSVTKGRIGISIQLDSSGTGAVNVAALWCERQ